MAYKQIAGQPSIRHLDCDYSCDSDYLLLPNIGTCLHVDGDQTSVFLVG